MKENWLHFSKQEFVICLQWREISWITKIVTRTQRLLHSATATCGLGLPHYRDLMIALRHITFCRTSLGGWSARHRYLYLTTHNTNKRQTDMTPGEIRTLSTSKRAATNPGCRPRYHWDWISPTVCSRKSRKTGRSVPFLRSTLPVCFPHTLDWLCNVWIGNTNF